MHEVLDPVRRGDRDVVRERDHVDRLGVPGAVHLGRGELVGVDLGRELRLDVCVGDVAGRRACTDGRDEGDGGGHGPRQDGLLGAAGEAHGVVLLEPLPVVALHHVGVELGDAGGRRRELCVDVAAPEDGDDDRAHHDRPGEVAHAVGAAIGDRGRGLIQLRARGVAAPHPARVAVREPRPRGLCDLNRLGRADLLVGPRGGGRLFTIGLCAARAEQDRAERRAEHGSAKEKVYLHGILVEDAGDRCTRTRAPLDHGRSPA